MTDDRTAVEQLLAVAPTAVAIDRAIALLAAVPVSGSLKRRLLGEWASFVGATPTPYEFDRAARSPAPTPHRSTP